MLVCSTLLSFVWLGLIGSPVAQDAAGFSSPGDPSRYYFPSEHVHDQAFVAVSRKPLAIVGARFKSDKLGMEPELLTVGPVELANGWTLGRYGREHVRVGDTVIDGIVQNSGKHHVIVTVGSGEQVLLPAGFSLYVGPYQHRPYASKTEVVHCLKCWCECGESGSAIFDCPDCHQTGNQCEDTNGTPCELPGGTFSEAKECREVLVICSGGGAGQP